MFSIMLGSVTAVPCVATEMMPRYVCLATTFNCLPPQVQTSGLRNAKNLLLGHFPKSTHSGTETAHNLPHNLQCSADGIIHDSCPSASGEKPAATLQPSHAICCIYCHELKCLEACRPSFRIWLRLHLVAKHAAGTGRPASVWRTSVEVLPLTPIVFEQMETTSG